MHPTHTQRREDSQPRRESILKNGHKSFSLSPQVLGQVFLKLGCAKNTPPGTDHPTSRLMPGVAPAREIGWPGRSSDQSCGTRRRHPLPPGSQQGSRRFARSLLNKYGLPLDHRGLSIIPPHPPSLSSQHQTPAYLPTGCECTHVWPVIRHDSDLRSHPNTPSSSPR